MTQESTPGKFKTCTKCGVKKNISCFCKMSISPDGLAYRCRQCTSLLGMEARSKKLAEDIDAYRQATCESAKRYRAANPEKAKAATEGWKQRNPDKYAAMRKASYEKGKASSAKRCKAYKKARLAVDPVFKLAHSVAGRLRASMKARGYTKTSRTHEILGCDWEFFKAHIERQFLIGMSWEKIGSEIHIDHIVPMATAKTEDEVRALNHFTNLRPMWAMDNYKKRAQITHLI